MDAKKTECELAQAVADYLIEELKRDPSKFISVHRDIAVAAAALANALAAKLRSQTNSLN